jgi:hypothetical protein
VFVSRSEKWHLCFDNRLLCLRKKPRKEIVIDYGIFGWTERRGKRRGRVGDCTPPVSKFFFFFVWFGGRGYIRTALFSIPSNWVNLKGWDFNFLNEVL